MSLFHLLHFIDFFSHVKFIWRWIWKSEEESHTAEYIFYLKGWREKTFFFSLLKQTRYVCQCAIPCLVCAMLNIFRFIPFSLSFFFSFHFLFHSESIFQNVKRNKLYERRDEHWKLLYFDIHWNAIDKIRPFNTQ